VHIVRRTAVLLKPHGAWRSSIRHEPLTQARGRRLNRDLATQKIDRARSRPPTGPAASGYDATRESRPAPAIGVRYPHLADDSRLDRRHGGTASCCQRDLIVRVDMTAKSLFAQAHRGGAAHLGQPPRRTCCSPTSGADTEPQPVQRPTEALTGHATIGASSPVHSGTCSALVSPAAASRRARPAIIPAKGAM
jgi:hypothetical protein